MAVLQLNAKNLNLQVAVGVLETYVPTQEVREINSLVEKLKSKTEKFMKDNWGEKSNEEMATIFKKHEAERNKWKKFLEEDYNKDLKVIIKKIDKTNHKLCNNYAEITHREE